MRQIKVNKEIFTPRKTRASSIYLNEVDRTKIMTPEEEAEIAFLASSGDEKARNKLIRANLRFVLTVAKNYAKNPDDFAEIVAVGNIGLVEAAEIFDPSRGFKFISFAVWHIRKQILKHLSENGRLVRLPQNQIKNLRALSEISNKISMEQGRDASYREAFETLSSQDKRFESIRYDMVLSAFSADLKASSLENPLGEESGCQTLLDILDSGTEHPDVDFDKNDTDSFIKNISSELNPVEVEIVMRKHSIEPFGEPYISYKRIADDMGLETSGEMIRVKYLNAIKKMRKSALKLGVSWENFV
jgi:RNA polymerase primary sigma factor